VDHDAALHVGRASASHRDQAKKGTINTDS
jgi:hypothetical protein